jgi:transposase InsO family protein
MSQQVQESEEALPLTCKCRLAGLSRASFYRHRRASPPQKTQEATDTDLCAAMHRLALELTGCGYRRMTRHLQREGFCVNHKKVRRLMGEEGLLCRRKKRFVRTTNSDHGQPVYRNLAKDLMVTGTDQLWIADITYVALPQGYGYLAALLDAYSRRCIGWALES